MKIVLAVFVLFLAFSFAAFAEEGASEADSARVASGVIFIAAMAVLFSALILWIRFYLPLSEKDYTEAWIYAIVMASLAKVGREKRKRQKKRKNDS